MDIVDQAQIVSEETLNRLLSKIKKDKEMKGTDYCIDCGEKIPKKRKQAMPNCQRCIACQEETEKAT